MRCLTPVFCLFAAPLLVAAVDLRGRGPATVSLRGNDGTNGPVWSEVTANAVFDSNSSVYRPFGVRIDIAFSALDADATLSLDMDLRAAPRGARIVHFPDPEQFDLRYQELRSGATGFGGLPYSGQTTITWATSPEGRVSFRVSVSAALFPQGQPGDSEHWRDLTANVTFAEALAGTVPAITGIVALPVPGAEPNIPAYVDPPSTTGCGGEASSASDSVDPGGCGGDSGSDAGSSCSGDGGAPDCNSGGGGAGAECAGGAAVAPECGVAAPRGSLGAVAPCNAVKRRVVHLRYIPYLAIFAMIALLRRRVRAREPAISRGASASEPARV